MKKYESVLKEQDRYRELLKQLVHSVVPEPKSARDEERKPVVMEDCELVMTRGPGSKWLVEGHWMPEGTEMSSMEIYKKAEWLMSEEE